MQACSECGKVYDESDNSQCPYCNEESHDKEKIIVYDDNTGEAKELTNEEFENFKKTHPDYQ